MVKHYRYALKEEAHVLAALQEECLKEPSLVLPATGTMGGLWQGGFRCVGNL